LDIKKILRHFQLHKVKRMERIPTPHRALFEARTLSDPDLGKFGFAKPTAASQYFVAMGL
jgi:hypothetical protein